MALAVPLGTADFYRTGAGAAPSGDFTAAFWWFTPAVLDQQYDAIFWMGTDSGPGNGTAYNDSVMIVIGNPANTIEVWARNSVAPIAGPTAAIQPSTWYYVTLVGNTGTSQAMTLYLDAVSAATGTSGTAGTYSTNRLQIGNDVNDDNSASSRLAYFTLHNSQLSLDRIRANMRSFRLASADAWTAITCFDDADGLRDMSGNARDWTENGSVTVSATDAPSAFDTRIYSYAASAGAPPTGTPRYRLRLPLGNTLYTGDRRALRI